MLLWYAEYSDRAVLATACGKSFCIDKTLVSVPGSACGCRQYLRTAKGAARQEGRGIPAHIKACRVSQEQMMETKPGIKHSPAGDPLARGKVVDKPSRFHSSFPRCSQFSHFIYPVWYSFKTGFFLFQAFQSSLASSLEEKIHADAPQSSAFLHVQWQLCSAKCCGVSAQHVPISSLSFFLSSVNYCRIGVKQEQCSLICTS